MRRLAVFLAALCVACAGLRGAEEILDFEARVDIAADGWLTVNENLRVRSEGQEIKRGIYRDFPTLYRGPLGLRAAVPFEVAGVTRDGKPEPWFTENRENGVRIYIGAPDVILPPGTYSYTITYRTARQIGQFGGHDELYWNVTGNGWAFPILHASVRVNLPPGANPIEIAGYTGPAGAKGNQYQTSVRPGCEAFLETTAPLPPGEGFTVVVTWPKGFVGEPTGAARMGETLLANRGLLAGAAGILLVSAYFFVAWTLHGRDPARGILIPLYAPPEGFTPQDVRYVESLGTCDARSFAAAILNLAVSGALKIRTADPYVLEKGKTDSLGDDERTLTGKLFSKSRTLELKPENHAVVQAARRALRTSVRAKNRACFRSNTGLWVAGLLLTLVPLGISLLDAVNPPAALFMLLWLGIWSGGCAALAMGIASAWRKNVWSAIPVALFAIPFFGGWVGGAFMLVMAASVWVCAIFFAGLGLCWLFHKLLKQPTPEGQRARDAIAGFKKYLSVAEAERLNLENPPERTPELFETFLPYALALDVEQKWSEQFTGILEEASYSPAWVAGTGGALAATALATSLGPSLAGAISSASSAPGSSSGSGGGGSSGGGGGGGGGGGW